MKRSSFVTTAAGAAAVAAVPAIAFASAGVTLVTPTGKLAGTLELPATMNGAPPVVLLIADSGATDALKLLAVGLAKRGIASLRYDQRGVGASAAAAPSDAQLHFEMLVDDAGAWLRELRAHKRFSRIAVAGHGEGSLIGMLAAQRERVDGFVSLDALGPAAIDAVAAIAR